MIINWHGDTCFSIKNKGITLMIDPFEGVKDAPRKADIVLLSEEREHIDLDGEPKMVDWPGEYEISDIPIIAHEGFNKSLSKEEEGGNKGNLINIFRFEMGDVTFCHLGNVGHVLKSDMVEKLGDIDILFIPAGEKCSLSAKKAHEIVEQIDPRAVVLMGEGSFDGFLKEVGAKPEEKERMEVNGKMDFQEDKTEFMILKKE